MGRIVVVGAGVGGLATAARLSALGHEVIVCEQSDTLGGKLGVHRREGFVFDTGPSLLTVPEALADTFAATGTTLAEALDVVELDPIARYRFADGTRLDVPRDAVARAASMEAALSPGSSLDWQRFLGRAGRIWQATEQPFLRQALSVGDLARRLPSLPTIAPGRSLSSLGRRYLADPRLRMLLDRYATYQGSDPRRAPAALATVPYAEQAFGAWYVLGGLGRIAQALAAQALLLGAELRTGADVTRVVTAGGRAIGVDLADGERLPADLVVANADATHLYRDLVDSPRAQRVRRRLARLEPSLSGFVLLLAVEGATPGIAHHNVLFPTDYEAEFDALFGRHPRPVPDPTLYTVVPDDPAVAPEGHEAWFVLANAPRQGQVDWARPGLAECYAEHLLEVLARRGLDLSGRLRFVEHRSPLDLARRTRAVGGAIYGTSSNGPRAAFLRPANRSPVPGLHLVGGSAHPGGGLPLVLRSAEIVAGQVGPA